MSARSNSNSDASYSDYAGSGMNNLFFGKSAYFATNNIALSGATDLTLTFGTEKYSADNGSVFTNSEFHIWLSNDGGAKWVEFTDYTFAGGTTAGRWNVATANFTVPAGTETLSICMKVDVASSYRLDDMLLTSNTSGQTGSPIDFSKGKEIDFNESGTSSPEKPSDLKTVTIAEFLNAPESNEAWYKITGVVTSIANETYGNFYISDETGEVYIYGLTNGWIGYNDKSFSQIGISVGDTITIGTLRGSYKNVAQGGGSTFPAYFISK
jgi:hypothetical protein